MAKRRRKSGSSPLPRKSSVSQRLVRVLGIVIALSMMLALIVPSLGRSRSSSPTSTPIPEPTETPAPEPTATEISSPTPSASLPLPPDNGS